MIQKKDLLEKINNVLSASIDDIIKSETNPVLDYRLKLFIFNKINDKLLEFLGRDFYNKFLDFVDKKGISLFIDSKDFIVTICFYDGLMFYRMTDVIDDYYSFIEIEYNNKVS